MAVSYGAIGAGSKGTTSCTPEYPASISADTSELFAIVTGRSSVADTPITGPAGWTSAGQLEGGTGTWGADTGTRRVGFFRKDTVTGSETGTETFSFGAGNSQSTISAHIIRLVKTSGFTVTQQIVGGSDTTNGTAFSATSSGALEWVTDDFLLIGVAQNIDTGTRSGVSISATGVTFGTLDNRVATATANGNDHRMLLDTVPVTSAASVIATATYAYTISAAGSGPAAFLLLREAAEDVNAALTGSAITSAAGTAVQGLSKEQTGQEITGAQGLAEPVRDRGQAMTLAQETIATIGLTLALIGSAITGEQGAVSANADGNVALSGQSISVSQETIAPSWGQALSGGESTASPGTLTIDLRPTNTVGQSITLAQGTATAEGESPVTVHLSGSEATLAHGDVDSGGQSATGSQSTAGQGTPTLDLSMPVTGVEITSGQGMIAPSQDAVDTLVTSAIGSVVQSVSLLLTGSELLAEQGDFEITGDSTAVLTGEESTASAGSVGFDRAFELTGSQIDSAQHPFGAPGGADLTGSAITVTAGDVHITNDREFALTGQSITVEAGLAVTSYLGFAIGQLITVSAQDIGPREIELTGSSFSAEAGLLGTIDRSRDAGKSRNKKPKPPRIRVSIDGEEFIVESREEAEALLEQARQIAEVEGKTSKAPVIEVPKELEPKAEEIRKLYDDDDDALMLLL